MPFNGSGTFQRVYNWVTDKNNSINITASRVDTEDTGFATGLSNTICRDGQSIITANLPMSGFAHTGVADATARTQYAKVGQIQDSTYNWIAAGGTADAITATYAPAVTALVDGMELTFRASAANATTTPTFAPNGLTAHTITKKGGSALVAGDIAAALAEYRLRYNLANTRWELLNPSVGGVTSVGLSIPGIFTITNSPVVSSGTLTATPAGTSGGVPYFSSATAMASSGALTANLPVIGGGAGNPPTVGTRSGNTTSFATTSGTLTNGHLAKFDSSGNIVDAGSSAITTLGTSVVLNPYATNTVTSGAHGLSSKPNRCLLLLECLSAEGGYSIGDVVDIGGSNLGINATDTVLTIAHSASTSYLITNATQVVQISRRDTAANFNITAASWKLTLTPMLIA